jgi:hypothetical protein
LWFIVKGELVWVEESKEIVGKSGRSGKCGRGDKRGVVFSNNDLWDLPLNEY